MAIPYFNNNTYKHGKRAAWLAGIHTCIYACGCVGNNLRRAAREHDSPYWGFFPAGEKPRARTQSVSCHRPGNHSTVYHFSSRSHVVRLHTGPTTNSFSLDFPATDTRPIIVIIIIIITILTVWKRSGSNPPPRVIILFRRMRG